MRVLLLLLVLLPLGTTVGYSQSKVHIREAKKWKGGTAPSGEKYERLIGNVVMDQQQTTIYCDSAHWYSQRNFVEAFGKIRITEGDSVTITGGHLEYDGMIKLARLRKKVVFTKLATATLHTDFLDYDRMRNMAYYYKGGNLVDSINTLTSQKGYYNVQNNLASFKQEVVVENPDYTMYSDSLQYNSKTKIIYFPTRTRVLDRDSGVFVYESGVYETLKKESVFDQGIAENNRYKITAGKYRFDDLKKRYYFQDKVVMTFKNQQLLLYGQKCWSDKATGVTKIFDRAYLAKITADKDTLFMAADTLVAIDDEDPVKRKFLAYPKVRIFKADLQGVADSLEYRQSDSTVYFYQHPVLWAEGNQLTADSIRMLIEKNTISRVFLRVNSFVISEDTLKHYNQIKGRHMIAELAKGKIARVLVNGNGETIYYATEADKQTGLILTSGMSKTICSNIIIRFREGTVNNLTFLKKPDSRFIPPHEIKKEEETLKGFQWLENLRPTRNSIDPIATAAPN